MICSAAARAVFSEAFDSSIKEVFAIAVAAVSIAERSFVVSTCGRRLRCV